MRICELRQSFPDKPEKVVVLRYVVQIRRLHVHEHGKHTVVCNGPGRRSGLRRGHDWERRVYRRFPSRPPPRQLPGLRDGVVDGALRLSVLLQRPRQAGIRGGRQRRWLPWRMPGIAILLTKSSNLKLTGRKRSRYQVMLAHYLVCQSHR